MVEMKRLRTKGIIETTSGETGDAPSIDDAERGGEKVKARHRFVSGWLAICWHRDIGPPDRTREAVDIGGRCDPRKPT